MILFIASSDNPSGFRTVLKKDNFPFDMNDPLVD